MTSPRIFLLTFLTVLATIWCEYAYYYKTFLDSCPIWPGQNETNANKFLKIMVISDPHIMGPLRSNRLDKMRREWQMRQAFHVANKLYKPDMIVFLGDILDEGSISTDENFQLAVSEFNQIFPTATRQDRVVVPGNHDIGFHDRMRFIPYLLDRFSDTFNSTRGLDLLESHRTMNLNIIVSNSMSFYNDTCDLCLSSITSAFSLAATLNDRLDNGAILFHHIPLYRRDEKHCELNVTKSSTGEGKEVMHKAASEFLLSKLRPRLVLSGHSHYSCRTRHRLDHDATFPDRIYEEITIPSFNHKYSKGKPGFLLLSANASNFYTSFCPQVNELTIAIVYISTLIVDLVLIIIT